MEGADLNHLDQPFRSKEGQQWLATSKKKTTVNNARQYWLLGLPALC